MKDDTSLFIIKNTLAILLVAILTGCASSRRMMRISPLTEKETTLDTNRINTWPLLYKNDKAMSIVWPIMDFDKDGFAIRPVFNKDNNDYSILFPLCGWNPKDKDGWFIPACWDKNYFAIIPVSRFGNGFNYLGPVWWDSEVTDNYECGIFPLVDHFGKGDYNITLFYKGKDYKGSFWGIVPLVHNDKKDFWFFPLYSYKNKNDEINQKLLLGFLGGMTNYKNGDYSSYITPLFGVSKKNEKSKIVTPLYINSKSKYDSLTFIPPFLWYSYDSSNAPNYIINKNESEKEKKKYKNKKVYFQFPTFYYHKQDNVTTFITLLFGKRWSENDDINFTNILGPVFHYSSNKDDNYITCPWPLFEKEKTKNKTALRLTPLFSYSEMEKDNPLYYLNLFGYQKYDDISSSYLMPLYWDKETKDTYDFYSFLGLGHYGNNENCNSMRLWPLFDYSNNDLTEDNIYKLLSIYSHRNKKNLKEQSILSGLIYKHKEKYSKQKIIKNKGIEKKADTKKVEYSFLTPLITYFSSFESYNGNKTIKKNETFSFLFFLYGYYWNENYEHNDWTIRRNIFPYFSEDGEFGKRKIPASANELFQNVDKTTWNMFFPFYYYKKELFNVWDIDLISEADTDYINAFIMLSNYEIRSKFCGDRYFNTSHKLVDSYINKKNSKELRKKVRVKYKKKYKEKTIEILIKHNVICTNRSDEDVMEGLLKLAEKCSKTNVVSEFTVPLLYNYKRSENITKWELLLGIVNSQEEKNIIKTSVLRYLYKKVKIGDDVTRDIFPFIKLDTNPTNTKISFLWRLFNYERSKTETKGHILFIPWWF